MQNNVLVTVPNLSASGGVSFYWNAILPHLRTYGTINLTTIEIGGHGKNIFGPINDQLHFNKTIVKSIDLAVLNPSLGLKSFFRDSLFARQLTRKNIPFVVFFHGWDVNFERKVSKNYVRYFNRSFGAAKKIIVLSKDFKDKLLEWGYKGEVIIETTTVDNGLLANFKYKENPKFHTKVKILFLARLLREKGVYETVDAFRELKKEYKDIELTIAGDGEEYQHLQDFVRKDEGIRMTGHVTGDDKINLFKNCDIYCLPTSYGEGLPTTVLEAMAFGVPVITTRVGGLKEFFKEGKMGYFVADKDSKSLADKIRLLLSNKDEMNKIGFFNYNYAKENVMAEKVTQRWLTHLSSLLSK